MAAGETKFECGRYRGKTYAFVESVDQDFCRLALESRTLNKYCPESFKNYLKSKLQAQTAPINEPGAKQFADAVKKRRDLRDEFLQLVGNPPVVIETIHDRLNLESNGFKGVFFRHAFLKYVFNLKSENAHSRPLYVLVNIFPFKIEPDVRSLADKVVCQLDDIFIEEIRSFLVTYFDDFDVVEHHRDIIDNFLSNIVNFRDYHFVDDAVTKAFCRWVEEDFEGSTSFDVRKNNNALNPIPQLNVKGARRYTLFYELYNEVAGFYGQKTLPIPTKIELMHLLETNIYDLLSLIDCEFYRRNRAEYTNRFEKYILFFVYSLRNVNESSVFFIDDCLYECAKAFTTYRQCGTDPATFKFEMSLCALMHNRKQPIDRRTHVDKPWYQIKDQDLVEVKRAAELYPKIETAKVNDTMENTQLPATISYLRTDDDLIDFCLTSTSKHKISDFFYLVAVSALYNRYDFKHLVIYNALWGEKNWIEITPERKRKVAEFIAKYNTNDSQQKIPPVKRLTWGLEHCFVDGTYHK